VASKTIKKGHVVFYVYIRKGQLAALKRLVKEQDTNKSALMRDMIDQYLKRKKIKVDVLELNDSGLA
jgi:hypothetical protein